MPRKTKPLMMGYPPHMAHLLRKRHQMESQRAQALMTLDKVIVDAIAEASTPLMTNQLKKLIPLAREKQAGAVFDAEARGLIVRKHPIGSPGRTLLCYLTKSGRALHRGES